MSRPDRHAAEAIAVALAPLLGWRVDVPADTDADWADLVRDDGARVRVRVGGWRREGRVEFYGVFPKRRDGERAYYGPTCQITCDAKRPAEKLAAEVRRRLLPSYDHEYAKATASLRAHEANADEARMVAERIAASVGGHIADPIWRRDDDVRLAGAPGAVHRLVVKPGRRITNRDGSVADEYPVRVSFEAHDLDPETAARVLAIIAEAERETPANARVEDREEMLARVGDDEEEEPAPAPRRAAIR